MTDDGPSAKTDRAAAILAVDEIGRAFEASLTRSVSRLYLGGAILALASLALTLLTPIAPLPMGRSRGANPPPILD